MVKSNEKKPATERIDSLYRGVRKRRWGKYVSEIRLPNSRQRIWLGSYDSEKAARAFDAAMFCLRGSGAKFNFPGNPPDIMGGRSMTPSQIQAAAAHFANSEFQKPYLGRLVNIDIPIETPSSSEGTEFLPMEASSPALSEVTVETDSDISQNGLFEDMFSVNGSGYCIPDYYVIPGFDDFGSGFYMQELPSFDLGEENTDGLIIQDSFLWNF